MFYTASPKSGLGARAHFPNTSSEIEASARVKFKPETSQGVLISPVFASDINSTKKQKLFENIFAKLLLDGIATTFLGCNATEEIEIPH